MCFEYVTALSNTSSYPPLISQFLTSHSPYLIFIENTTPYDPGGKYLGKVIETADLARLQEE
jgi:hypothetical protein